MSSKEELICLLQEQIRIEQQTIDSISEALQNSRNTAFRLLLNTVQMDATKYRNICQALIDLLSGSAVHLIDKVGMTKIAKQHLSLEEDALRNIGQAIKKAEEANVKTLLQFIESDERKHHEALESLINRIQTPEEISFQDELGYFLRPLFG
ncbi:MAG: hypothetical protein QXX08_07755 [Candidatus Bathyarchaeia archaeon]